MSRVGLSGRSFLQLTHADLRRLADIARDDRETFFARYPEWATLYADRVVCTALCQGAALHALDGTTGIQDFDVYTFYAAHPARRWYAKRLVHRDFGDPRFGQSPDAPAYCGRRVDLLGRGMAVPPGADPVSSLRSYLRDGVTTTARLLARKAVILLTPIAQCGTIVWPYREEL
jgi:hypothetical protein